MQINLISFSLVANSVALDVYTQKVENQYPQTIYKDEVPELWQQHPELEECHHLFFSITNPQEECAGEKYTVNIELNKQLRLTKHIISGYLYNHFKQKHIVGVDFVDNLEVWVKDTTQPDAKITRFLRFSLAPQYQNMSADWELLVSYNGCSTVYNKAIDTLNIQTENFKVIVNHQIVKHKNLTPTQKQDISRIYPILNRELCAEFGITETRHKTDNKYTKAYKLITQFAKQHLFTEKIEQIIHFNQNEFIQVPDGIIKQVPDYANTLLFGNSQKGVVPYSGFKNFGPYMPTKKNKVCFFFIYHKPDEGICKQLYSTFKNGLGTTPALANYIKQPFNTEPNGSISFTNPKTAIQEISQQLANKKLESDCTYVAIYISPINKDNTNSPLHDIYFKVKELLLHKKITSQVIYKENPSKDSFSYHLPNIAIALLAKIGGTPWQLQPTRGANDLIIGVGAFKSKKVGARYVGSAFCFNKEGIFQNFDCYNDQDLERLISDIRRAIMTYVVQNEEQNPQRLIIHYYKTMGAKESRKITDMLERLGFNIPVIIVTINKTEASDIVAFDTEASDLMPMSGTYIELRPNLVLLYNNSKYPNTTTYDKLFPIKVRVAKIITGGTKDDNRLHEAETKELLSQVYQLSRMYWKSVKQQNLPITIKYPEMVAKIVPHFSDAELPPFGKSNLWFL